MQLGINILPEFTKVEILADNGEPANAQNPVDEIDELPELHFPKLFGNKLLVSGTPTSAAISVGIHYKGVFNVILLDTPRLGGALVIHSTDKSVPFGTLINLPANEEEYDLTDEDDENLE